MHKIYVYTSMYVYININTHIHVCELVEDHCNCYDLTTGYQPAITKRTNTQPGDPAPHFTTT